MMLTTILGNLDVQTHDRIITMVYDMKSPIPKWVNRSDWHLSEVIRGADEVAQRMLNYAHGEPHSAF
ncbi:MAG: hypothetical protein GPOALKHO_000388 [Sodalis sp.]|nr:MAG: hypothetical protein GPOALKHO_000388 [Sodalis sp.]